MTTHHTTNTTSSATGRPRRAARVALWLPGLLVAVGAAVATAHGLYEVARAAETPPLIAGLYPLITDGLALVAYAATARLTGSGRRYAWAVVVLAAGLSGLAQASYLAEGVHTAPAALRFGIGAWPAIAAAIVAHLLYLIAHAERTTPSAESGVVPEGNRSRTAGEPEGDAEGDRPTVHLPAVHSEPASAPSVRASGVQPTAVQTTGHTQRVQPSGVRRSESRPAGAGSAGDVQSPAPVPVRSVPVRQVASPARDRADQAAQRYAAAHGELPTVTHLMELAEVSRGTAGEALKALRAHTSPLHLVSEHDQHQAHS